MAKTNTAASKQTVVHAVLVGCGIAIAISFLGILVIAIMLNRNGLEETELGYAVMVVTSVSSAIGALVSRRGISGSYLPLAFFVGLGYYIVLLIISFALFSGPVSGMGVTGLLVLGSSICTSFIRGKGKKANVGHVRKYVNR